MDELNKKIEALKKELYQAIAEGDGGKVLKISEELDVEILKAFNESKAKRSEKE